LEGKLLEHEDHISYFQEMDPAKQNYTIHNWIVSPTDEEPYWILCKVSLDWFNL